MNTRDMKLREICFQTKFEKEMESSSEILIITTIARESEINSHDTFLYRSCLYKKLLDWKDFDKLLCRFLILSANFFFKILFCRFEWEYWFFHKNTVDKRSKVSGFVPSKYKHYNPKPAKSYFCWSFFREIWWRRFWRIWAVASP